jgi:hypothetical protein
MGGWVDKWVVWMGTMHGWMGLYMYGWMADGWRGLFMYGWMGGWVYKYMSE